MSARTLMATCARPGAALCRRMPSACEAWSRSYSACAARRARSSACSGNSLTRHSLAEKARRALLGEGSDAFGIVSAAAEFALIITLDVELLWQCAAQALVERLLGARQPARGCRGQLARERIDHGGEFSVLDAAPDQAPLGRLLSAQLLRQ